MENKIKIAELLKDCPKGMELDCTMFDNVSFLRIQYGTNQIIIQTPDGLRFLNSYGSYHDDYSAKCVIFPKGKTIWEVFIPPCKFNDGDILATDLGSVFYLNTLLNTDECYGCYVGLGGDGSFHICEPFAYKECCGLATEEEKQKLFNAIQDNGYKWNSETKTLENLVKPKFKEGDRIKDKNNKEWFVGQVFEKHFDISSVPNAEGYYVPIAEQDEYELVPNKFDITTLKPFDSRVLVREGKTDVWRPTFYGFSHKRNKRFYTTMCGTWLMCIPYNEDTKHLTGTTDDCDEYYKTWE